MANIETSGAPTNRVVVIGTLDTIRDRGKEVLHRAQRNTRRGKMEYLAIQVRSPYGGSFLLPLVVESGIRGGALLQTARAGTPIALEGEIQLFKRFDRRFADNAEDEGRQVREMYLNVLAIRPPTEEELYGTSAVWLTGEVVEPPRFFRHSELPDIQLAITVLEVTLERPSPMPGSRAVTSMPARVRVAIPTAHPHADFLRARASFLKVPCVQVLAGYVELLAGERATMDEARAMRREHIARMRDRRAASRQMRTQASGNGCGPAIVEAGPDVVAVSLEQPRSTAPATQEAAGLVQPVRARQRRDRTAASGGTGTIAAELAPVTDETLATEATRAEDAAVDAMMIIPVEQVLAPAELTAAEQFEA